MKRNKKVVLWGIPCTLAVMSLWAILQTVPFWTSWKTVGQDIYYEGFNEIAVSNSPKWQTYFFEDRNDKSPFLVFSKKVFPLFSFYRFSPQEDQEDFPSIVLGFVDRRFRSKLPKTKKEAEEVLQSSDYFQDTEVLEEPQDLVLNRTPSLYIPFRTVLVEGHLRVPLRGEGYFISHGRKIFGLLYLAPLSRFEGDREEALTIVKSIQFKERKSVEHLIMNPDSNIMPSSADTRPAKELEKESK